MPHITNRGAGGSLTYKSMITHLHKAAKPHGDPGGIRTRIIGVRGRPPKPLEDGAICGEEYPRLRVDLDLSTSPNGGLQVILAIITLTGLLYNCFRTRLISRYW